MRLVLVDVDGTLLEGTSSERRFFRHLLRRGLLGPAQLGAFLAFAVRHRRRYGADVWKKDKAYLAGLRLEPVAAEAERFVARRLLPAVRPVMRRRIEGHRAAGDVLALLTGTPAFLARPLAEALAIPHVIATRCDLRAGRFTAAPPPVHPYGAEKERLARALAAELRLPLEEAVAYADSASDRPLLAAVGEAVAVHPDTGLRSEARGLGWEILGG
ncbi:HAD family hydrolase [Inmirania thermothiophila]|uniref:HAD superfamily hydrolase (TIGR01490 family) n=1 Tax=Inmirania thermothiophila TaxID=1750597 RepID=A0A3N1Y753_9GAMM|nr:HAD-IB family hydrolase [Inmirania thermothiophila]ROR34654.1 HAD superfamily hydrolase (TIGR01490 family) [Inmirania thermothiophila]